MLDTTKINAVILNDLEIAYEDPSQLDVRTAIDRWLRYNGIVGYTTNILTAIDSIRAAYRSDVEPPEGTVVRSGCLIYERVDRYWYTTGAVKEFSWGEIKDNAQILWSPNA